MYFFPPILSLILSPPPHHRNCYAAGSNNFHAAKPNRGAIRCRSGKESACQWRSPKRRQFDSRVGKVSWRRARQPTPVFLPGESNGQRSPAGYSVWGRKESEATEQARTQTKQAILSPLLIDFNQSSPLAAPGVLPGHHLPPSVQVSFARLSFNFRRSGGPHSSDTFCLHLQS